MVVAAYSAIAGHVWIVAKSFAAYISITLLLVRSMREDSSDVTQEYTIYPLECNFLVLTHAIELVFF